MSSNWPSVSDPFLSLEQLTAADSLAWVDTQNKRAHAAWGQGKLYDELKPRLAEAYMPRERPIMPDRVGDWAYDVWDDDKNPKGLWRRTLWSDWRVGKPAWELLLDIDALGKAEGVEWVLDNVSIVYPEGDRALITLSNGGSDAVVMREFDISSRSFLEDGFRIDQAGKHDVDWIDRDSLYVGWDNGGDTLTSSGYPRQCRRWVRGTALADAPVVFEGEASDVSVRIYYDPIEDRHGASRSVDFFDALNFAGQMTADPATWSDWRQYDLPTHVVVFTWKGWLLFEPRLAWEYEGTVYPAGSLLAIREDAYLRGERNLVTLFAASERTSGCRVRCTLNYMIVAYLEDVQSQKLILLPVQNAAGDWEWQRRIFPIRIGSQVGIGPIEETLNDEIYVASDDYLNPPKYYIADLSKDDLSDWERIARWPTLFDNTGLVVRRCRARSADGTMIPYTVIGRESSVGDAQTAPSPSPCLLTGYGGFSVSMTPYYLVDAGIQLMEKGVVYVVAHIRGGGEYGSRWHTAAQAVKRQHGFDDFIAVAQALIDTGVTTPTQLGIQGGSNGGLLVGACMVQRPELFGAVICEVPLLDMQRYHLLHAGASWMAEYGNPDDPVEGSALAKYSPYHHVKAGVTYPATLLTTSISDDRVHPAHARKMAARMISQGHDNIWYLENQGGGHGSGSDPLESAAHHALVANFLWSQIGGTEK